MMNNKSNRLFVSVQQLFSYAMLDIRISSLNLNGAGVMGKWRLFPSCVLSKSWMCFWYW